MSERSPKSKLAVLWAVMLALPAVLAVVAVQGFYLYGFVTFETDFCGSFAALDGEIGWVLAPGTESCISGTDPQTGVPAYHSTVFVNADGARAASVDSATPVGGLLAIGDSWTFGFGIDWAETFAASLTRDHGLPTALFASPAYSGAQALLLGERAAVRVKPHTIVYLELGFWGRAVCTGDEVPSGILKPCYWVGQDGVAHLIVPPPGEVEAKARFGLLPGGMVGAGEKTLTYFQISRPIAKARQFLVRLGLRSGFGDDFAPVGMPDDLAAIRRAHYEKLAALAERHGAQLLLIDPQEVYREYVDRSAVRYIGAADWQQAVADPMGDLPPAEAQVPVDGHYGPGTHRLIADMIAAALRR